ncbi:MAG TPA: ribulose-phosphate 3-epimerase [Bacteroidales bacterium]|nr:MAG: Ribulose-phosphate 3-epimerase [Bacteroidetes bacterium ADurb.Bin217]HPH15897.1 ribulose-phosphate 3-epimerase [Bacteroidales bacterium]
MVLIAPSLLSADFSNLRADIEFINQSNADWFHLDIMDGVFVPNISFGLPVVKAVQKYATKPLDVHLMITNPDAYISQFRDAGADWLTVHYEACTHLHRTVQSIHQAGIKAGVSINPHTPVSVLEHIICDVDLILIMSVNPGFGGQSFIPESLQKIKELQALIKRKHSKALIEVDGGIDTSNAAQVIAHGAQVLVAGNAIFSATDRNFVINSIKNNC